MSDPLIVYWSSNSGGTKRVAEALNTRAIPLHEAGGLDQSFIILCPSFDQPKGGYTPKPVEKFLEEHGDKLVGVIGVGNRTFGTHYCQSAHDISAKHGVPVLWRIEIMGTTEDYDTIDAGIEQHWGTLLNMKGLA